MSCYIRDRQLEAFPWDHAPRYLIRDRDTSYGPVFVQRLRAMGIRDRPIAFRSPWQNAYVERLIGSIRRQCLDHMIVFGEAHLRRILGAYAAYYNESRTHRSLNNDAPFHRAIERLGTITYTRFSAAFTTNIAEPNFRYTHPARLAVRTSRMYSRQAGRTPIFTLIRESSQESRINSVFPITPYGERFVNRCRLGLALRSMCTMAIGRVRLYQ